MDINWTEEKKASINGIEIPIECILMSQNGSNVNDDGLPQKHSVHYHDYVEILYGISGNVEILSNGKTIVLSPNTMAVINSKTAHTVYPYKKECGTYMVIKYMPQVLYAAQQSIYEFKYAVPFIINSSIYVDFFDSETLKSTELPEIMKKLYEEWESKAYGYEIALRIYVLKISLWLVRYWHKDLEYKVPEMNENENLIPAIAKAMDYTRENYASVTALKAAEVAGISYSYFSRIFKKIMNMSFNEYLSHIRMSEAKKLLICTDSDITEIAMNTGFSTTSYFIDKFKKQDGTTPKQFRLLYRKSSEHSK